MGWVGLGWVRLRSRSRSGSDLAMVVPDPDPHPDPELGPKPSESHVVLGTNLTWYRYLALSNTCKSATTCFSLCISLSCPGVRSDGYQMRVRRVSGGCPMGVKWLSDGCHFCGVRIRVSGTPRVRVRVIVRVRVRQASACHNDNSGHMQFCWHQSPV